MMKTLRVGLSHSIPVPKKRKKILFANVPADGHFNPLTSLAIHLQSIGYDVRWYSSSYYSDKIKKLNIPHYPFKKALEARGDNLEEVFPERKKYKSQVSRLKFDLINFFILRSTEYYEDIAEIHETFAFDLMICDVAFSAIPFVKEKLNVPVIAIGVFPLAESSKDLAPNGLGITPSNSWLGHIKQTVLRFLTDKFIFGKPTQVLNDLLKKHGIDGGKSNVFDILYKKSTLLLQSGTAGFEYNRSDLGKNIRYIGPLLPYSSNKTTGSWFSEKLNQYEKVILVTQGTVEKDLEKIIIPTLDAFKNTGYLVVATTGGSKTSELKERYPFDNIIIEDFIPFADIMPYADVYVTNGGYGGVLLAIENELPMVMAGIHEGKNEINARLGYFKLGINLGTESPKATQIRSAVEQVLANDIYETYVKELSKEFKQFDPLKMMAFFVEEVLGNTHKKIVKPVVSEDPHPERLAIY